MSTCVKTTSYRIFWASQPHIRTHEVRWILICKLILFNYTLKEKNSHCWGWHIHLWATWHHLDFFAYSVPLTNGILIISLARLSVSHIFHTLVVLHRETCDSAQSYIKGCFVERQCCLKYKAKLGENFKSLFSSLLFGSLMLLKTFCDHSWPELDWEWMIKEGSLGK